MVRSTDHEIMSVLHYSVASSLSDPNIILSMFSDTLSLRPFFSARDQVSHILSFMFSSYLIICLYNYVWCKEDVICSDCWHIAESWNG